MESNKRVQGTRHKVSGPLTRDVGQDNMKHLHDRILLITVAAVIVAAIAGLKTLTPITKRQSEVSEPTATAPIVYRPTLAQSLTPDNIKNNQEFHDNATRIIHRYYGNDANISISYINADIPFIEIRVGDIGLGGDGSYVGLADMYASLCRLNDKTTILNAIGGIDMLADYHAIEVYRGNRKPIYWDEEKEDWGFEPDEPWKRNKKAYGVGLTSRKDMEYEKNRVDAIVRARGLSPFKEDVQQAGSGYPPQGVGSPDP